GSGRAIILSDGLWRRRFGARPGIIGQTLVLDGAGYEVRGVAPASFWFSPKTDAWTLLQAAPDSTDQAQLYRVIARMEPGVTEAQLARDAEAVAAAFRREYENLMNARESIAAVSLIESMVGDTRRPLLILFGMALFVLMIACSNVANLQLTRAISRQNEIAIRVTVGADRWRVIRQVLVESLVLSFLSAVGAVALSLALLPFLIRLSPDSLPRLDTVSLDWRVLVFALSMAALAAAL